MGTNNFILMILILLTCAFGLGLTAINFTRELALQRRRKINYENYAVYKKYFQFKPKAVNLVLCAVFCFCVVALSFFIIGNDMMNVYLPLLLLILALNGLSTGAYWSSQKYNRNLQDFDEYHKTVEFGYENKGKVENNIKKLRGKRNQLEKSIENLEQKSAELFIDHTKIANSELCFEQIDNNLLVQENLLKSFDGKLTELFTQSLRDYLNKGGQVSATQFIGNSVSDLDVESLMTESVAVLKEQYKNYVADCFLAGKHKNADALTEICNILQKLGAFDKTYAVKLVEFIDVDSENYGKVVDYLYQNKLVDYDLLIECNKNNYDWIYVRSVGGFLNSNQFVELIADIITRNSTQIANRLLIFCTKSDGEHVKNAVTLAGVSNETSVLLEKYVELLQVDGGFVSISTRYENLTLVLRSYVRERDKSLFADIETIAKGGRFLENKEKLERLYNQALLASQPVLRKAFQTILYYSLYCGSNTMLSHEKINILFAEYKKNLRLSEMMCLCALLDGLMLVNLKDKSALKAVADNIVLSKDTELYDEYYPLTVNKNGQWNRYGQDIIRQLFKNHYDKLATIACHIENDRLFVDKIRYIQ